MNTMPAASEQSPSTRVGPLSNTSTSYTKQAFSSSGNGSRYAKYRNSIRQSVNARDRTVATTAMELDEGGHIVMDDDTTGEKISGDADISSYATPLVDADKQTHVPVEAQNGKVTPTIDDPTPVVVDPECSSTLTTAKSSSKIIAESDSKGIPTPAAHSKSRIADDYHAYQRKRLNHAKRVVMGADEKAAEDEKILLQNEGTFFKSRDTTSKSSSNPDPSSGEGVRSIMRDTDPFDHQNNGKSSYRQSRMHKSIAGILYEGYRIGLLDRVPHPLSGNAKRPEGTKDLTKQEMPVDNSTNAKSHPDATATFVSSPQPLRSSRALHALNATRKDNNFNQMSSKQEHTQKKKSRRKFTPTGTEALKSPGSGYPPEEATERQSETAFVKNIVPKGELDQRRRNFFIGLAVIFLVLYPLAVGLGVGLTQKARGGSNANDNAQSDSKGSRFLRG